MTNEELEKRIAVAKIRQCLARLKLSRQFEQRLDELARIQELKRLTKSALRLGVPPAELRIAGVGAMLVDACERSIRLYSEAFGR